MTAQVGSIVLRRQFEHTQLSRVWVGRVVADDESGLLMWVADGSPLRDVIAADGREFYEVPFKDWGTVSKKLAELTWVGDALMLHPPGAGYSVWWFFGPGLAFRGWYVNLERPGVRWADADLAGIDTIDYDIDLQVAPDRSWQWKDEEQFAEHLRYDHYWVDDEAAVRASATEAVKLVNSAEFPFDGSWCDLRPGADWMKVSSLPPGWDRNRAF